MEYERLRAEDIDALDGERWFPKESNFIDDLPLYWGDWGVASEVEELKACIMRRPGKEIEDFNYQDVRFLLPLTRSDSGPSTTASRRSIGITA